MFLQIYYKGKPEKLNPSLNQNHEINQKRKRFNQSINTSIDYLANKI